MKYLVNNYNDIDDDTLIEFMKKYKYNVENIKYEQYENEQVKILTIVKDDNPNWYNKKIYNTNHACPVNKTYHEIIICKIINKMTLFIINGSLKIMEGFIKKQKYNCYNLEKIINDDKNLTDIIKFLKSY